MGRLLLTSVTFLVLLGCKPSKRFGDKEKMKIDVEVGRVKYYTDLFYVQWKDTITFVENRPIEVRCFVTNDDNDTIAKYHWLRQSNRLRFRAPEGKVKLNFYRTLGSWKGKPAGSPLDTVGLRKFLKENSPPTYYQPLEVALKAEEVETFETVLIEK